MVYRVSLFVASMLFLIGMRMLTKPESARRGMQAAVIGMVLGVVGTLLHRDVVHYHWIIGGLVVGTVIGVPMGLLIPMTKMPERIALSHAGGGLAVALVGIAHFYTHGTTEGRFAMGAIGFEVLMGAITFTGSLMAFGKLQGFLPGKPTTFPGQNVLNFLLMGGCLVALITLVVMAAQPTIHDVAANPGLLLQDQTSQTVKTIFYVMTGVAFLLGILLVMPIGGADMPVVICLLNSYAGLAASASGFALDNNVLIICGALDGGSGFILAMIMSKAMNRSFSNVLFGAFGSDATAASGAASAKGGNVREGTVEDAAELLKIAQSVIIVPGYGMAVAQAQHAVRDLSNAMIANGTNVRYAIHPVAGRMPGHMNVLLAEANVPYDQLYELDAINDEFQRTDVAIVVGANDVVNPAAKNTPGSPIFGMPILNCDQAKAVIVLKRSMNPGFAGIENELFVLPQTMMVFGDAKNTLTAMSAAMKGGGGH
ncbi:MAG TPA: NAD(P)(+) transhydrogenase (Re/Si-specific) subunit beta [Planctomycetota bacterium]|nr:NAD(P)(+) transhydrogenase (Re/Si-specific) subunit beta [Planctomycetota bacterium]